ncbi:MAG TPA: hypothetical protein PLO27_07030, partial [Marmoricola sp.]|nr:hypothetical protein [Marmoricola sp.]
MAVNEIICPHCQKAFKIDEAGYAEILKQVRDREFESELHTHEQNWEKAKQAEIELAKARTAEELQAAAAAKDLEIQRLVALIEGSEMTKKLAVNEAVAAVEKQRDALKSDLERVRLESQLEEKALREKYEVQLKDRDETITRLHDL